MQKVERPQAEQKKIRSKDEFELCYLRHQYIRKVDYNPTKEEMEPYFKIINKQAKKTYVTYLKLLRMVGMGWEDVVSIGQVHLVSYLGLFALDRLPEKRRSFIDVFEQSKGYSPENEDFLNKNKANFTMFLKQRMEDLIRVSRQKVRNIRGFVGKEHYVYCGPTPPPQFLEDLVENYDKYGYRKVDIAVFKTIRKRAKANKDSSFEFGGLWYVNVNVPTRALDFTDFEGADLSPADGVHNQMPDSLVEAMEDNTFWEDRRIEFYATHPDKRMGLLTKFLEDHKNEPKYQAEVKLAMKLFKQAEKASAEIRAGGA